MTLDVKSLPHRWHNGIYNTEDGSDSGYKLHLKYKNVLKNPPQTT